jgi:general secretion pathway protein C
MKHASLATTLAFVAVWANAAQAPPADLAAVGVVVGASADRSVAILESGGRTRLAGVGERVFGGRVTSVARNGVTLDFDGRMVELRLTTGKGARSVPRAVEAQPQAAAPHGEAMGVGGPSRKVLDRAQVERRLAAEMPRLMQAALRPVTEGGRVIGMRVSQIPEGTVLQEVGLRSGDVLTNLNGMKVDGLPALFDMWSSLQGANEIDATVLRDGVILGMGVSLR